MNIDTLTTDQLNELISNSLTLKAIQERLVEKQVITVDECRCYLETGEWPIDGLPTVTKTPPCPPCKTPLVSKGPSGVGGEYQDEK